MDALWNGTCLVLADACAQLAAAAGLEIAAADDAHAPWVGRRLLLPAAQEAYPEVVVIEAHRARAAFPLLLAARVRFRKPIPRLRAVHEWHRDPPLGALVDPAAPLSRRHAYLTPRVRPSSFAAEIELRAWPLLELVDAEAIEATIVEQVRGWQVPARQTG